MLAATSSLGKLLRTFALDHTTARVEVLHHGQGSDLQGWDRGAHLRVELELGIARGRQHDTEQERGTN